MKSSILFLEGATAALLIAGAGAAFALSANYTCSGGATLSARFAPSSYETGKVDIRFGNGRSLTLPQVVSADGGRYAAGDVEFWIKGTGATLTRGADVQTCTSR
jgi:membrane-bound inhibitor of C-type lysozyme